MHEPIISSAVDGDEQTRDATYQKDDVEKCNAFSQKVVFATAKV